MSRIDIITLFPEFFEPLFSFGPIKRALDKKVLSISLHNLKDFADSPKEVDDYPFGGGSGMVLKIEPLVNALRSVKREFSFSILFDASGERLNQNLLKEFIKKEHFILICGRYKGVDERFKNYIDMEISIGDYVLSGAEPACFVFLDAFTRLLPGAIGNFESAQDDSFQTGILGYPVWTKPREFEGLKVPDVLLSGNHKKIEMFRKKESLKKTLKKRPDLLITAQLSEEDKKILEKLKKEETSKNYLS